MVTRPYVFLVSAFIVSALFPLRAARAAEPPFAIRQASVIVQCGNRQGSGVVINASAGYVLTNAHVLLNDNGDPDHCIVGFIIDQTYLPKVFYRADADKYVFDATNNRDFAILKLGNPTGRRTLAAFPIVETDEFSQVGDPITMITYPTESMGAQLVATGTILALEQGAIETDAFIGHGSSGGPGVDAREHLIGLATGILYQEVSPGVERLVGYELVDIRAILIWLDTFGVNVNDTYVTHADFARYHGPQVYIAPGNLSCRLLVKSIDSSAVFCLKINGTRAVFPNNATYASWFSDFSPVISISPQDLAQYPLTSNITMRMGTLVKIESDPRVYLISDAIGTLRLIPSELRARELFGDGWAGFVKDIPVAFFQNYHIGEPIPE